jgi:hypothetical protein
MRLSIWTKYGFAWVTFGLFLFSLVGHWLFGWIEFVHDQEAHGQAVQVSQYAVVMARDTFENWQSEFLQLMWQVAGLAYFLYVGSPQSKEEDDRLEHKVDAILRELNPKSAEELIGRLDARYPGRSVGPQL